MRAEPRYDARWRTAGRPHHAAAVISLIVPFMGDGRAIWPVHHDLGHMRK